MGGAPEISRITPKTRINKSGGSGPGQTCNYREHGVSVLSCLCRTVYEDQSNTREYRKRNLPADSHCQTVLLSAEKDTEKDTGDGA